MQNPAKNNPALSSALVAPAGNPTGGKDRSLWLWVAGGFLLVAIMWVTLFTAARSAKIESVPLAPQTGNP